MNYITYTFVKINIYGMLYVVRIWSKIGLLKGVEKLLYILFYHILHYRKSVIEKNLMIINPLLSSQELKSEVKKYYKHFTSLIMESLWCYTASKKEVVAKIQVKNPEILYKMEQSNENFVILLSHIGNWELFCQYAPIAFGNFKIVVLYTPIKNTTFDRIFKELREKRGAKLISTKNTLELYRYQKQHQRVVNLFAIDQNPGDPYNQYWTQFFDKKVPVISGAEKFATSLLQKVLFLQVECLEDGYIFELKEIEQVENKPFSITHSQMNLLEKNIKTHPTKWLLSHNRFKYDDKY